MDREEAMIRTFWFGKDYSYSKNRVKRHKGTIVFLHGLTGHSGVWENYMKHFCKSYNVLAIDIIGHGRSSRPYPFCRYSPKSISKDILEILRKENISSAQFVVHSSSFILLLELVTIRRSIVTSAVVISPYYPNRKSLRWKIARTISLPLSLIAYFLPAKKKFQLLDYKHRGLTADFEVKRILNDISRTSVKSYVALTYYLLRYKNPVAFRLFDSPILIVSGRKDQIIPIREVEAISKRLKTSRLVVMERYAHVMVFPFHKDLIPIIDKFVKGPQAIYIWGAH